MGKIVPEEIKERLRFEWEVNGKSVYRLSKEFELSQSTINKYKKQSNWNRSEYISQYDRWKDIELKTRENLGESILNLSQKLLLATQEMDTRNIKLLLDLVKAAKSLAVIVGLKSSMDLEQQQLRIEKLRISLDKLKSNTNEPIKIEIDAPEEYKV